MQTLLLVQALLLCSFFPWRGCGAGSSHPRRSDVPRMMHSTPPRVEASLEQEHVPAAHLHWGGRGGAFRLCWKSSRALLLFVLHLI